MQIIIESAKESMDSALKHLEKEMLIYVQEKQTHYAFRC